MLFITFVGAVPNNWVGFPRSRLPIWKQSCVVTLKSVGEHCPSQVAKQTLLYQKKYPTPKGQRCLRFALFIFYINSTQKYTTTNKRNYLGLIPNKESCIIYLIAILMASWMTWIGNVRTADLVLIESVKRPVGMIKWKTLSVGLICRMSQIGGHAIHVDDSLTSPGNFSLIVHTK